MNKNVLTFLLTVSFAFLLLFQNCGEVNSVDAIVESSAEDTTPLTPQPEPIFAQVDLPRTPPPLPPAPAPVDNNNYIVNFASLDALANGQQVNFGEGAVAKLYYMLDQNPGGAFPKTLQDKNGNNVNYPNGIQNQNFNFYYQNGIELPTDILMNQIAMPVRLHTQPFVDRNGNQVLSVGNTVIRHALVMDIRGALQLPAAMEGNYEFAIISDDSVILEFDLNNDGIYETSVINDNLFLHPATLECSNYVLPAIANQRYNFRLQYHNGPTIMSLMLLMRRLNVGQQAGQDNLCNVQDRNRYFGDPTVNNYTPNFNQGGYANLVGRGWFTPPANIIKRQQ